MSGRGRYVSPLVPAGTFQCPGNVPADDSMQSQSPRYAHYPGTYGGRTSVPPYRTLLARAHAL